VGYLPNLVHGQTLTAQDGSSLTVSVKGEEFYVNGARIEQANLVLENGVAHVISKVCFVRFSFFPLGCRRTVLEQFGCANEYEPCRS